MVTPSYVTNNDYRQSISLRKLICTFTKSPRVNVFFPRPLSPLLFFFVLEERLFDFDFSIDGKMIRTFPLSISETTHFAISAYDPVGTFPRASPASPDSREPALLAKNVVNRASINDGGLLLDPGHIFIPVQNL